MIIDLARGVMEIHNELFSAPGSALPYLYAAMIIAGLYKVILSLIIGGRPRV